jgi:hypothetical protein
VALADDLAVVAMASQREDLESLVDGTLERVSD